MMAHSTDLLPFALAALALSIPLLLLDPRPTSAFWYVLFLTGPADHRRVTGLTSMIAALLTLSAIMK